MNKKLTSLIILFVVCLTAMPILADVTGRITGTVVDVTTKEPLVGATVALVGTTRGAITDANGRYTILNVPVGTYTLRISSVGYSTVEVANVGVSADLATYQDHSLSSAATDIGKTISVTAEAPLVIKDKTASISVVKRDEIQALPTRGFEQIVSLQNSVVRTRPFGGPSSIRGDREATNGPELNLRGGRPSEVAYFVDGYSTQDPLTGKSTANISNNAIQEVSIIAGGFPAEYGNVASGIVNTITNSGTNIYHGNLEALSDNVFGGDNFDQNWYSADLSGPLPGLNNAFFFISGERRWHGDRNPSALGGEFALSPFKDRALPGNWLSGWSGQAKFDFNLTPEMKLALSGTGSRDEWREYIHSYLFNNAHMPYYDDRNFGLNGRFTHTLNARTFYNLSASWASTERFRGDGVHRENLLAYARESNPSYDRANEALFWAYDYDTLWTDTIQVDTGGGNFVDSIVQVQRDEGHVYDDMLRRKSSFIGFRGDITSEVGDFHTLKAGVEFQRHTLRYYNHLFPVGISGFDPVADTLFGNRADIDRYGYDEFGNEADLPGDLDDAKHPINMAVYLQDRFEWRGLIINGGVRFDYFDYKAKRIKNLQRPFDPDGVADPLSSVLDEGDLEDSEKFTRVSPRLGISFPVSDRTQVRLNYGKFFQRPDLQRLYVGYEYFEHKVNVGGYYYAFGNPNLQPEKTTAYEVGLTHQLGDNTYFDLGAFYRDILDQVQVYSQAAVPTQFSTFRNSDYGTVKGLEFHFGMRRTNNIVFDVKYSLQYASGTGSYANTQRNVAWTDDNAPKQTAPLDFDQRHNINAYVDWRAGENGGPSFGDVHPFENFGLNVLFRAGSGLPYTPVETWNEVTLGSIAPIARAPRNTQYGPWTFSIDLKATKDFRVGRYSITPYLVILNLLDRKNVVAVYESSGRPNTTGWLETSEGQQTTGTFVGDDRLGFSAAEKYQLKENNPLNYGPPRQIMLGLQVGF